MQDACSRFQAAPLVTSVQIQSPVSLFLLEVFVDVMVRDALFVLHLIFLVL